MAAILLTEEEYTFVLNLEKDLLERAKTASPRASTHLRAVAKMHSDFLAREEGNRAASTKKATAREQRETLKLQRQQERLTALQQRMQEAKQQGQGQKQTNQGPARQTAAGQKSA